MPISQISKINPIEIKKQPEPNKPQPEKGPALSTEVPRVEFGQDQIIKTTKTPSLLAEPSISSPLTSDGLVVDAKFKKIEAILEEDLGDIYFSLSPQKQQEFKAKGEETTIKIIGLLAKPKIQIKKIISLIRDWLKIIPGINVFFLEQEVKIKADKIINETSKKN